MKTVMADVVAACTLTISLLLCLFCLLYLTLPVSVIMNVICVQVLLLTPIPEVTLGYVHRSTSYVSALGQLDNLYTLMRALARSVPLIHSIWPWTKHTIIWTCLFSRCWLYTRYAAESASSASFLGGQTVISILCFDRVVFLYRHDSRRLSCRSDGAATHANAFLLCSSCAFFSYPFSRFFSLARRHARPTDQCPSVTWTRTSMRRCTGWSPHTRTV